jgi:(p)ppGpp synthase/HD superfamily hydrolase
MLVTQTINKALDIVLEAFNGVVDKGGKPYVGHLIRVASNVLGSSDIRESLTTIALLHDLIEDTNWTEENLRKEFTDEVVDAVVALTKVKGETNEEYITKVLGNKLSVKVKLADLKDNMDITRLKELNEGDIKRLKKYHKTFLILKNADNEI